MNYESAAEVQVTSRLLDRNSQINGLDGPTSFENYVIETAYFAAFSTSVLPP